MVVPANAQHYIGVVGGLNIANLRGDDEDGEDIDFSSRTVFGIGGVLDLGLNENIALRLEPMYLQKGAEFDVTDPDLDSAQLKFKAAYLEVPVFLKFAFGTSATRPYVMAGPTIGFNLSSKFDISAPGINVEVDIDELTETIDFGFGLGGGVSFPMGNNSIFVEGRYTFGLTDIIEDGTFDFMDEEAELEADIKTRGIQFMVGM